ncbi:hypothetical protein RJ640_017661 [Escallonia rubra]|uniref:Uncharacterized GPI-anchored protein At5g19230-like domain-containing protein n=1 Tax=Escallonia rubra TaxID=112253 RepID=A0AA88QVI1_9ASTE|nr:hypothetical protein RJ640_017661 [Escallonia rubra]
MTIWDIDTEDHLIQGLNSYRQSQGLQALAKNGNADCFADKVANRIQDRPCNRSSNTMASSTDFPDLVRDCNIDMNTTRDAVILPVCVPDMTQTLVLTNYTQTTYSRYLNNTRFTGVGTGHQDNWMVVVLSTTTPGGSFAEAANTAISVLNVGLGQYLMPLLLGLVVVLAN